MAAITIRDSVGRASLASRASTVITTEFPSDEQRPEDLTNEELYQAVQDLQASNRQMFLENDIFERFLKRTDPPSMTGFDKLVEQATAASNAQNRVSIIASSMLHPLSSALSMSNLSQRSRLEETTASHFPSVAGLTRSPEVQKSYSVMKFGTGSVLDRGPRINLRHKMEMAGREMEELRVQLEKMQRRSKRVRADLRAQLEQLALMIREVRDSHEELTRNVVVGAVDSLTHAIPAEKFVRHMEEWLKRADSMVGKLRLKTSTLRALNIRVQTQLVQKLELGETLHPVDFDHLQIENLEFLKKIDQKNHHLLELKKMTGSCNLQLTNFRDRIAKELKELTTLQATIASKKALIDTLNNESLLVGVEVEKAEEKLCSVKYLRATFTVPDVLEYAKVKGTLTALRRAVKIWTRRLNVQHTSLIACMRAMQGMSALDLYSSKAYTMSKTTEPPVNRGKPRTSVEKDKAGGANNPSEKMPPNEEQAENKNVTSAGNSTADVIRTSIGSIKKNKITSSERLF